MPHTNIPFVWTLFCVCFGLMLIAMFIMGRQSRHFYTVRRTVRRRFSIMDLEFPESYEEQRKLIQGITRLKDAREAARALKALNGQLWVDYFLYMPATYGGIFLMCYALGSRNDIGSFGHYFFTVLAFAQILAFVLDAIENAVLLRIIALRDIPLKNTVADSRRYRGYHRQLQLLELVKWGAAMLGAVCGFSALCYYWLQGAYADDAWMAVLGLAGELLLYGWISNRVARWDERLKEEAARQPAPHSR